MRLYSQHIHNPKTALFCNLYDIKSIYKVTQLSPVLSGENISLGERSFLLSPFWVNARDYTLYHPIKKKCCNRKTNFKLKVGFNLNLT